MKKKMVNRRATHTNTDTRENHGEIEWLDNVDVMRLLKISRSTLARWRKMKLIPYYCIAGKIYYRRDEIDAAIINSINKRKRFKVDVG